MLLLFYLLELAIAQNYFLGHEGESCFETCIGHDLNCNELIETNNSKQLFDDLGVDCLPSATPWWADDQPSFVTYAGDYNFGHCVGYVDVPARVSCGSLHPNVRRLCRCDPLEDRDSLENFGIGLAYVTIHTTEKEVFAWTMPDGVIGVMAHFWIAGPATVVWSDVIIRYYVDGEHTPSVEFTPDMAAGVGFDDLQKQPWSNQWIGKGAKDGAWLMNIRIPFQKQIRITWQHLSKEISGMYLIIHGSPQLPISIGGFILPTSARLVLYNQHVVLDPLEYFNIVNITEGSGLLFMHTLSISADTLGFIEGCYRIFTPPTAPFPGKVIATGTEDYFDSAHEFNGGKFHGPLAGLTHYNESKSNVTFSAYRIHEDNLIRFSRGFRFVWRNGDAANRDTGEKCYLETGGRTIYHPSIAHVVSYAWVYQW